MNNYVLILLLISLKLVIAGLSHQRSVRPRKSLSFRLPLSPNKIIARAAAFGLKPRALSMDTCHG
jgi:hypothetical protein